MAEYSDKATMCSSAGEGVSGGMPAFPPSSPDAGIRWRVASEHVNAERDDMVVADIGGTSIKLGYLRAGQVGEAIATYPTSAMRVADPAAALATLLKRWSRDEGLSPALVVATVPGLLDDDYDTVLHSLNLPELNGRAFASELAAALDTPVVLERDAVLQLIGERAAGVARGEDHVLGIYLGTGIGAAYLAGGVPLRGGGWALELGHRRTRRDGMSRAIGTDRSATESLEDRASGVRLQAIAAREGVAVGQLFEESGGLSDELLSLVDEHALAISDCLAFLSPSVVVVGGGLVEMPGYPWARMLSTLEAQAPLPLVFEHVRIVQACLGWRSALHGALAECRAAHQHHSTEGVSP